MKHPLYFVLVSLWCIACPTAPGETTIDEPGASTGSTGQGSSGEPDPTSSTGGPSGGMFECDPWKQDCPAGLKCNAWADDSTEHWNATRCVPVYDDPAQPGEPCQVEGWAASGLDDCAAGSLCWYLDYENLAGTCIPACTGSPEARECPDGLWCDVSNGGTLLLCLQTCDPLVPSCPPGQVCFGSFSGPQFICDSQNVGELGMYGEPCSFINSCAYGLHCAVAEEVPGCVSERCCNEHCDVTAPNTCSGKDGGQQCLPWFAEGQAPPGLEKVGSCGIP